jgi:protein-S-isoprenylcysteine O-methyltransferase Ste14
MPPQTKNPEQEKSPASFVQRGGMWVLAQALMMCLALIIPLWDGTGELIPGRPLAFLGAGITALGLWLTLWGTLSLGRALTPYPVPRDDVRVQRQGAYRFMRHPMYAGVLLGSLGWAIWWVSLLGLLFVPAFALFFDRKASYEEVWLRKKDKTYVDYERKVKKFIPGVY